MRARARTVDPAERTAAHFTAALNSAQGTFPGLSFTYIHTLPEHVGIGIYDNTAYARWRATR